MSLYAALLAPIAWRIPGHAARMLHGFARAERSSQLDLMLAANATTSTSRRALYVRHALDEARHASMFARRAEELRRARGEPPLAPVEADTEQLFTTLGELGFLAFVHAGEARGRAQLARHAATCRRRGDDRSAALFEAILPDEARHERYTRELLVELAGGEARARRAILRARLWEARRAWRRVGRSGAQLVFTASMLVLYLATAPFAVLVRVKRPVQSGWVGAPRETRALGGAGPTPVEARRA
jgi:hypothetical protein